MTPPTIPAHNANPHTHNALLLSNPLLTIYPERLRSPLNLSQTLSHAQRLGTYPAVLSALLSSPKHSSLLPRDAPLHINHTLARNIVALDQADRVAHTLKTHAIRAIALKGLSLLHTLYSDRIERRGMSDIDLLIDVDTFHKVTPILSSLGWTRTLTPPATTRLNVEAVFHKTPHPNAPTVTLELHRRLTFPGRFSPPHQLLWSTATSVPSSALLHLQTSHAVLYLAAHKALHLWRNDTRDLIDAANLLLHAPESIWDDLLHNAPLWSAKRALWLLLTRIHQHLHSDLIPPRVLSSLRPEEAIARRILRRTPNLITQPNIHTALPHMIAKRTRIPLHLMLSDDPLPHIAALSTIGLRSLLDRALKSTPSHSPLLSLLDRIPLSISL